MPWVVGGARKKSLPANWVNKIISIPPPFVRPSTSSCGHVYSSKLCPSKGGQTMPQFAPSRHGADSSLEHSLELQHPKLHLALLCLLHRWPSRLPSNPQCRFYIPDNNPYWPRHRGRLPGQGACVIFMARGGAESSRKPWAFRQWERSCCFSSSARDMSASDLGMWCILEIDSFN